MRLRHPLAETPRACDDAVDLGGTLLPVEDGELTVPDRLEPAAQEWAAGYDTTLEALRVTETCDVVKSDGEVCGRELPCQYHSED